MEIMMLILTIFFCTIASLVWYWHREHQKYDHLPGPPRDSFWSGHLHSIQKTIAEGGIIDDYYLELSKKYGDLFRICTWYQTLVVVLDPELIKDVLVTGNHPRSKRIYDRFDQVFGARFMGRGLQGETDQKLWVVQRMHLDHWFKPQNLRQFTADMNEYADRLYQVMDKYADGKTSVSMGDLFHRVTIHILTKVAFSFDLGSLEGPPHRFLQDMHLVFTGFAAKMANPLLTMNPLNWMYCQKVRTATHSLRKYAQDLIMERKDTKRRGDYVPFDLLESMLELQEKHPSTVTEDVIVDNFTTFLIGGHETTANTLCFVVILLSQHPQCYKKLQQEIDSSIGAVSVITPSEIDKLPYMDMVIKETLRMYPVGRFSTRETVTDYVLGGHVLPAGTDVMACFYCASRSEKNVKDPLKFMPERFDPNNPERLGRYHSTPFSAGPHTCIGKKFAQIEAKILLAKIMQNLDFELVPGQPMGLLDNGVTKPIGDTMCYVRQRKM